MPHAPATDGPLLHALAEQHLDWSGVRIATEFRALTGRGIEPARYGPILRGCAPWWAHRRERQRLAAVQRHARRREDARRAAEAAPVPAPAPAPTSAPAYHRPPEPCCPRARQVRPAAPRALGPLADLIDEAKRVWRRLQRDRLAPEGETFA